MSDKLDYTTLKAKRYALKDDFPDTMGLRVHRAISWIGRAEECGTDADARFIFLWVSFNAAYADEQALQGIPQGERSVFADYFSKLVSLDEERRIYRALWQRFSGPVRLLMENHYVFEPFWKHHNGIDGYENWKKRLEDSERKFRKVFERGDTAKVLSFVFDRLYVLRNQLVHGGSTWNSDVNRDQVRDGAEILGFLMPVFVDIMMDNPAEDWGKPFYPVVS